MRRMNPGPPLNDERDATEHQPGIREAVSPQSAIPAFTGKEYRRSPGSRQARHSEGIERFPFSP
jgi:hypothetical protein